MAKALCDLWLLELDEPERPLQLHMDVLSPDELERAARYKLDVHRRRFVVARAQLRGILARYLGGAASAVRFNYGEFGKPAIANLNRDAVHFNLSHSHAKAVVAVTRGVRVGADIELIGPIDALDDLVRTSFSAPEIDAFAALPPERHLAAFYRCWTCKEAYLKGRGDGLNVSLADFDVEVDPQRPAALLRPYTGDGGWTLHAVDCLASYAIAVAVAAPAPSPRIRWWNDASTMVLDA